MEVTMTHIRGAFACVLLALAAAGAVFAQGVSGSITGALKDTSGAVIPNSSVTARSVESGREWQTRTNEAGI
jgi:hypothetical protein